MSFFEKGTDYITYDQAERLISSAFDEYKEELKEEKRKRNLLYRLNMFLWKLRYDRKR